MKYNEQQIDALARKLFLPPIEIDLNQEAKALKEPDKKEINEEKLRLEPVELQFNRHLETTIKEINDIFNEVLSALPSHEVMAIRRVHKSINEDSYTPKSLDTDLIDACAKLAFVKLLLARHENKAGKFSQTNNIVWYGMMHYIFCKMYFDEPFKLKLLTTFINEGYTYEKFKNSDIRPLEFILLSDLGLIRNAQGEDENNLLDLLDLVDDLIDRDNAVVLPEDKYKNLNNEEYETVIAKPAPIPDTIKHSEQAELDSAESATSVLKLKFLLTGITSLKFMRTGEQSSSSSTRYPILSIDNKTENNNNLSVRKEEKIGWGLTN